MGQLYNYTATLTQRESVQITGGTLLIGETYTISNYVDGDPIDDFSNIANVISGTINQTGCIFIATGTTPTSWANGSTLQSAGNPIATIIDTNCNFSNWINEGSYFIRTNLLLDSKKTIITLTNTTDSTDNFSLANYLMIDTNFDFDILNTTNGFTYKGREGLVNGIHLVKNDNLLIYGTFDSYKGIPCSNIVIVSTSGTIVNNFDGGFYTTSLQEETPVLQINDVKKQIDGKLLIVGDIGTYKGKDILSCIVRLNTDGSIDDTFKTDGFIYLQDRISTIDIQKDGKILVGGSFAGFNQNNMQYQSSCILRLNTDGTIDQTFNISPNAGFNGVVHKILIQPDEKILVGGEFTTYNKVVEANYFTMLNLNGLVDTSFGENIKNNKIKNIVNSITLQSDGKILIGGIFDGYLTRLNSNGLLDTDFESNISNAIDNIVRNCYIQSDGKVLVVGDSLLKRINSDGTNDNSFTGFTVSNTIHSIIENKGKIYFGGIFTYVSERRDDFYPNSIFSIDNTSYISLNTATQNFDNFGIDIKIYE